MVWAMKSSGDQWNEDAICSSGIDRVFEAMGLVEDNSELN